MGDDRVERVTMYWADVVGDRPCRAYIFEVSSTYARVTGVDEKGSVVGSYNISGTPCVVSGLESSISKLQTLLAVKLGCCIGSTILASKIISACDEVKI